VSELIRKIRGHAHSRAGYEEVKLRKKPVSK
jgi:hypothetical protein